MFQILKFWQAVNVVFKNSHTWLFSIMIFLSACQLTAIRDQAEPELTFTADRNYVTEGEKEIQVSIKRTVADELEEFKIQLEGDATLGGDYLIEFNENHEDNSISIQLLPGEREKEFNWILLMMWPPKPMKKLSWCWWCSPPIQPKPTTPVLRS